MATKNIPQNNLPGEGNCPYGNANCCKNFHGNPDTAPENFKRCQTFIMKNGNQIKSISGTHHDKRDFHDSIH